MSNGPQPLCPTGLCGYGVKTGDGECDGGDSSCANARLAAPQQTNGTYYTDALRDASIEINNKLAGLGQGPAGYELSFLRTPLGVTVGWIKHAGGAQAQGTRADDPAVIGDLMIAQNLYQGDPTAAGKWTRNIANNEITCSKVGGDADCWIASFLVADATAAYHPQAVRDVVFYIQGRLKGLYSPGETRKLALIKTNDGMQLVWARQI